MMKKLNQDDILHESIFKFFSNCFDIEYKNIIEGKGIKPLTNTTIYGKSLYKKIFKNQIIDSKK